MAGNKFHIIELINGKTERYPSHADGLWYSVEIDAYGILEVRTRSDKSSMSVVARHKTYSPHAWLSYKIVEEFNAE